MRATQNSPYVEMLVPRRKGQLLKLLILVPMCLLLATSIYYQFYYEQPPLTSLRPASLLARQPVSAAMSRSFNYGAADPSIIDQADDIAANSFEMNDDAAFNPKLNNLARIGQADDLLNHPSHRRSAAAADAANSNSNSISQEATYEPKQPPRRVDRFGGVRRKRPLPSSKVDADEQLLANLDERRSIYKLAYESRDNQQLALDAARKLAASKQLADQQQQPQRQPQPQQDSSLESSAVSLVGSSVSLADNSEPAVVAAAAAAAGAVGHEGTELREEEADADQDAAVIPPPSDPTAPGELGRPVVLKNLTKEQQNLVKVGWDNNAFNQYVSDIISLNRTLPDVRDPVCKDVRYPNARKLPPTSVIICFHNEAWSVLLRTVHSIINRSPRRLVKEIILVDDYSNKAHLGQQLEDYIKPLKIVKIVRASKREGLIRARLLGARAASAPVLTFLDSHCECAEGWLEPLLTRIHQNQTAVVCPVIDVISDKTFEYHYKGDATAVSVGGFDWNLQFNWHSIPEREKKRRRHPYDPIRSPTMAGGLFSIDRAFFERLGTYDSGFDIWGGENLELSFKTWMCGGTLEILPCSHVGHVFRSRSPYKWRTGVNVLRRNSVRLAEVWMDDYKRYYYDRIGHDLGDYGDISERVELRKQLQCKPFSYFVKEIYPELFIPGEAVAYGEVRNEAMGKIKMCLDSSARKSDYHKPLGLYPCHGSGGNQYWLLSRDGEIRRDEACVDYAGKDVVLFPCHGSGGNQLWNYDIDTMQIRHSTSGRCMELTRDRIRLQMSDCDSTNDAQRWTFGHYNATLAAISNHNYN